MSCLCQSDLQDDCCPVHGIEFLTSQADAIARLEYLRSTKEGWGADGDEPAPSSIAIDKAIGIVKCIVPDAIDLDAMGGIALWFYGENRLWIHVKNDGTSVLTVSEKCWG